MKLDAERDALTISPEELSSLGQQYDVIHNALSLLPTVEISNSVIQNALNEFDKLNNAQQTLFKAAVASLASPSQTAKLHYTTTKNPMSRMLIAWSSRDNKNRAILEDKDNSLTLSIRSDQEIKDFACFRALRG